MLDAAEGGEVGFLDSYDEEVARNALFDALRGHALAAKDLFDAGSVEDAAANYYFPATVDHYDAVADDDLKTLMNAAGDAAFDGDAGAVASAHQALLDGIGANERTLRGPAELGDEARVLGALLQLAAFEYSEALHDGVLTNPTEYAHSRGFVRAARDRLTRLTASADGEARERLLEAIDAVDGMLQAYPGAVPPIGDVGDLASIYGAAARAELALSGL